MKREITPDEELSFFGTNPNARVSSNVTKWTTLFAEGKLTTDMLKEYWFTLISDKCAVQSPDETSVALESIVSISDLINELEEFIYNDNKEAMNDYLIMSKKTPTLCAKPFKTGEPSYNCKECGTDSTCVMCVDCFQKSNHRHHKYKMGTSAGGGFCDCGDPEAWKSDPFCESHLPPSVQDGSIKPELPSDIYQRCKFVFSLVIKFSIEVVNKHFTSDVSQNSNKDESVGKYLLVMYNDEVHTFDQVINLLVHVIKCTSKQGLEFASKINKEGRAVIASSDFRSCCRIKYEIERLSSQEGNKFLEVHVLPLSVVVCQNFALHALDWVQKILKTCVGFRLAIVDIFRDTGCAGTSPNLLDTILLQDPELWKSARLQWNLLICSGMLMEYDYKQLLGIHFVKNFHSIMQNYMIDDEDHPFSVACLSVQLFTVPSIAYNLIAEHDALKIVIDFLITVSANEKNSEGKLEFSRSLSYMFERASFALHDARYLLCSPPSIWSEKLKIGFLSGISTFIDLLSIVEGMDAVMRQLGTHIEFEPEWETAFKLLTRIYPVVAQACEWCCSDRTVLLEVYKMVLIKLDTLYSRSLSVSIQKSFGTFQATCIPSDFVVDSVTVHLPLTRFFGALHLYLSNFNVTFTSEELNFTEKPSPMVLIEQVVKTRTMISQSKAGLWRKNGHSLQSQLFFYHNTKFRGMMLDMDITVLQVGASLIDNNTFLINLLYKFGLLEWNDEELISELPETDSNQVRILVEEFFHLILVIVAERYQVGIGNVSRSECIKYEITHLLTVKAMPHSELIKGISSNSKLLADVENVINDVAVFKTEDNFSKKGFYELQDGYPGFYNPYFFHFSKEEMFKSEQALKARHKKMFGLECCPPPILPPFCEAFRKVGDLLKCDVMLRVMKMVLVTFLSNAENSGFEGQLEKVLFLIGVALRDEEKSEGQIRFTTLIKEWSIDRLILDIYRSPDYKDQKDMVKWILMKYQGITNDHIIDEAMKEHESRKDSNEEPMKKRMLAETARASIMAKMKSMQEKFANKNVNLLASTPQSTLIDPEMKVVSTGESSDFAPQEDETLVTCMLCQEDEVITVNGRPVVLVVHVQLSTVLMRNRKNSKPASEEADTIYLSSNMAPTPYICTCGHAMHAECYVSWRVESIRRKANGAPSLPASLDSSKEEYLCPLCGSISNGVILIAPSAGVKKDDTESKASNVSFAQWLKIAVTVLHVTKYSKPKNTQVNANNGIAEATVSSSFQAPSEDSEDIKAFTFRLEDVDMTSANDSAKGCGSTSYYGQRSNSRENSGYNVSSGEGWVLNVKKYSEESFGSELLVNNNQLPRDGMHWINDLTNKIYSTFIGKKFSETTGWSPTQLWKTVAYTIHSIENNLRCSGRPLLSAFTNREQQCLGNLVRIAFSMGECNQARLQTNKQCLKCLSYIIENESGHPCILNWDCFGMLIVLLVTVPNIVHIDNSIHVLSSMGRFLLRLMLISQVAQCLISIDVNEVDYNETEKHSGTDCLKFLASLVRHNYQRFNTDAVWNSLKEDLKPFLRCCAILQYFHAPNSDLCGLNELDNDTFENLCSYLKLPYSCQDLLGDEVTQSLFVTWATHPSINGIHCDKEVYPMSRMSMVNELIDLPDDYSELLNMVRYFSCPNSNLDDSHNPTLCLVCGEILCSLSYCCQKELNLKKVGACTFHAYHCGGGSGLFLKIRECQLMMFAGLGRGCFKAPPYLDEHGETDQGLRRGNKLRLCRKSYKKIQTIWMTHGVYEEVSRAIERDGFNLNSWQYF